MIGLLSRILYGVSYKLMLYHTRAESRNAYLGKQAMISLDISMFLCPLNAIPSRSPDDAAGTCPDIYTRIQDCWLGQDTQTSR